MAQTASATFLSTIQKSYQSEVKIQILQSGTTILGTLADTTVGTIGSGQAVDGNVTIDKNAAIRRRLDLKVIDPDLSVIPAVAGDLLSPYGNELQVYRGATLPDGSTEMIPLGIFRISTAEIIDSDANFELNITAYDRSRFVSRARFTDTYVIAPGSNIATAIQNIVTPRLPLGASFYPVTLPYVTGTSETAFSTSEDPWQKCIELAKAAGLELFFDVSGNVVLRVEPTPNQQPVSWTLADGSSSVMISLNRSMTDEGVFNYVVAQGESSGNAAPVRAVVSDTNASSPTYTGGAFGTVPTLYKSPLMIDSATATQAATSILNQVLGRAEVLKIQMLPNPAMDVNDVVQVNRSRAKITNYKYSVEQIVIPLRAEGSQTVQSRLVS